MFTGLVQHAHKLKYLLNQNSSTILASMGVIGTVSTAVLTGRSSFKAAEVINKKKIDLAEENENLSPGEELSSEAQRYFYMGLSRTERVRLVWPLYIPPVTTGAITIASIIFAHRIDAKKIAALTTAAGISERAFQEYKEKAIEKWGPRENEKIRDEIAQNRVNANPPRTSEIIPREGKVLCQDQLTGRYFMSTSEDLKRAENRINHDLVQHMDASLSEFYEQIGLDPTTYSDSVGWNSSHGLVELEISTVIAKTDRGEEPCFAVDFRPHPFPEYFRTGHIQH